MLPSTVFSLSAFDKGFIIAVFTLEVEKKIREQKEIERRKAKTKQSGGRRT